VLSIQRHRRRLNSHPSCQPHSRLASIIAEVNPTFFTLMLVSLNAEWWGFSIILRSVLNPVVSGIHNRSRRNKVTYIVDVLKTTKHVPLIDLFVRIFFIIIPALVGAWTRNDALKFFTFFFFTVYSKIKYIVYFTMYSKMLYNAITILKTKKNTISSSKSGSTESKLKIFKQKLKFLSFILMSAALTIAVDGAIMVIIMPAFMYANFASYFLMFRAVVSLVFGIVLEIMYNDSFWVMYRYFNGSKRCGTGTLTFSTFRDSKAQERTTDEDKNATARNSDFKLEIRANPLHERSDTFDL